MHCRASSVLCLLHGHITFLRIALLFWQYTLLEELNLLHAGAECLTPFAVMTLDRIRERNVLRIDAIEECDYNLPLLG